MKNPSVAMAALLLLVSGCATWFLPKQPAVAVRKDQPIGVYAVLDETPVNSHVGTTVFNNFRRPYPGGWDLSGYAVQAFRAEVARQIGAPVVDLRAEGMTGEQLQGLVDVQNQQWAVKPEKQALANRLRQPWNLTPWC